MMNREWKTAELYFALLNLGLDHDLASHTASSQMDGGNKTMHTHLCRVLDRIRMSLTANVPNEKSLSSLDRKLLNYKDKTVQKNIPKSYPVTDENLGFMFTQIPLPRHKSSTRIFERVNGNAILRVESCGDLPLPYGSTPRLILAALNAIALRQKSPIVKVSGDVSDFLRLIGVSSGGGKRGGYTLFRDQLKSLAATNLSIKICSEDKTEEKFSISLIQEISAWQADIKENISNTITFSTEYFELLKENAIPLDLRALKELSSSTLALDLYVTLAEKLHRIKKDYFVSWEVLFEQFSDDAKNPVKHSIYTFSKTIKSALLKVKKVYPAANVNPVRGGLVFRKSPPPVHFKYFKNQ